MIPMHARHQPRGKLGYRRMIRHFQAKRLSLSEHVLVTTHGAITVLGPKNSYLLGPWPELASQKRYEGGPWRASVRAGEQVLSIFDSTAAMLVQERRRRADRPILTGPSPWLVPLHGDFWAERKTGQALLHWESAWPAEQAYALLYVQSREFQAIIPGAIRTVAKQFSSERLAVLRLLSACPSAVELARGNPAVFYALATMLNRSSASAVPRSSAYALLNRPQTEILNCSGLPATNSARRLFGKIPSPEVSLPLMRSLGRALATPGFGRCLPHLPCLSPALLRILGDESLWGFLTPALINEYLAHHGSRSSAWGESNELYLQLGLLRDRLQAVGGAPIPLRSLAQVRAALNTVDFIWDSKSRQVAQDAAGLPRPPLCGSKTVVPITTVGELIREGQIQANCVSQRWQVKAAWTGQKCFFRVLAPERATAQVTRAEDGTWVITDLRTRENGLPQIATVKSVVAALGIPASPVWYPAAGQAWWIVGPYPFVPEYPQQVQDNPLASLVTSIE